MLQICLFVVPAIDPLICFVVMRDILHSVVNIVVIRDMLHNVISIVVMRACVWTLLLLVFVRLLTRLVGVCTYSDLLF